VGLANQQGRPFFGYGVGNLQTRLPLTEHSFFEMGSVTKTLTATLLAQMVRAGEVSISDKVQDYLPAAVTVPSLNGIDITLLHLATHSSGLSYVPPNMSYSQLDNLFAGYTVDLLYEGLNNFTLPRNPGAGFEYSNLGVGLLGHALGLRAGIRYEELLRARILAPLGMNETFINLPANDFPRRTTGYGGVVERPPFEMDSLEAAGSLVSTVHDMLTFLEFNAGIRSDAALSPVFADTATFRRATDVAGLNLGLIWWLLPMGNDTVVFHDGATFGQSAFAAYRRNTKTAVIVFTNTRLNQYSSPQDIGLYLLGALPSLTTIQKPAIVPVDLMRRYHGLYTAADGSFFDMRLTNNFLTFSHSSASNFFTTLYQTSARSFQVLEPGVTASGTFTTNSSGIVTSMLWSQSGGSETFQRVTADAKLEINKAFELTLHGDSQHLYSLEGSGDFLSWTPISTHSIWTNRIALPASPSRQFFRALQQ
jgi:serine-type D-Ala-D-Ala carboxypeptidase/endopeptidase